MKARWGNTVSAGESIKKPSTFCFAPETDRNRAQNLQDGKGEKGLPPTTKWQLEVLNKLSTVCNRRSTNNNNNLGDNFKEPARKKKKRNKTLRNFYSELYFGYCYYYYYLPAIHSQHFHPFRAADPKSWAQLLVFHFAETVPEIHLPGFWPRRNWRPGKIGQKEANFDGLNNIS